MFVITSPLQHKCDLINMSYGEPTLFPDYGRFVDLVNEVRSEVCFFSFQNISFVVLYAIERPILVSTFTRNCLRSCEALFYYNMINRLHYRCLRIGLVAHSFTMISTMS